MPTVEQRLKRLEDREALQDLIVRYFVASDDDDYDTLAATFTSDAKFYFGSYEAGTSCEQIVEFIRYDRTTNMGVTVHTPNYLLIDFTDDDHATGVVGAHLELSRGGKTLYGAFRYHDHYERIGQGWKISRRELLTIHVGPWEEVATSLTSDLRARWPGSPPEAAHLPKPR